jgi:hypothetical protein
VNVNDWVVLALCAVLGWVIVSWIFNLVRQQKSPPIEMQKYAAGASVKRTLSFSELAERWHHVLNVPSEAGAAEIERAYHDRLAECGRVRFSATASPDEKRTAEERRDEVNRAFEFIRPAKQ